MVKNLLIVESPAKGKTIEKFLGKEFAVASSIGHIRDIPKKGLGVDIENGFIPTYEIASDKKKLVQELKKQVQTAKTVYLATDDDREGEAIAWHLCHVLNLDIHTTYRITFNEVTKSAIQKAIENPKTLNIELIEAQRARRVIDRLVGYELSPVLWKKISGAHSAGRVQSPTMRLVVEREKKINSFKAESTYQSQVQFKTSNNDILDANCLKSINDLDGAKTHMQHLNESNYHISDVQSKETFRNPSPPFTTSTLQQEASSRLGFSVKQTMVLAQNLYRQGHITYMRTDSVHLSDQAIEQSKAYIFKTFGNDYLNSKQYTTKSANAQEAHEAIRPTDINIEKPPIQDEAEKKLYQFIWERTLSSQMTPAKIARTDIIIDSNHSEQTGAFKARGEIIIFDGYFKIYSYNRLKDKHLGQVEIGEKLLIHSATTLQTFSQSKGRYTEASLVRELEKLGIGRPSTYAAMASTVQERGYVVKQNVESKTRLIDKITLSSGAIEHVQEEEKYGGEKNKLLPTPLADLTADFLINQFKNVIDYEFTALLEKQFDQIALGQISAQKVLETFYQDFHATVLEAEKLKKQDVSQIKELGIHPETKRPISVRLGRYGPFVQMGLAEDEQKPVFASLPEKISMNEITLEHALTLLQLPRELGKNAQDEMIVANQGRFGPYVKYGKNFVSIKPHDPNTINLETALNLIDEKIKADQAKVIKAFEGSEIKILNGRFGPYISNGKKKRVEQVNISIKKVFPDVSDPKLLTLEQCQKAIKNPPKPKPRSKKK